MRSLIPTIIKSLLFVLITGAATLALAATIRNGSSGDGTSYKAVFTDVTSLNKGDDIRMAGVKVGSVTSIDVADENLAEVGFTVEKGVEVTSDVTATVKFRNLIGQRYIALDQGAQEAEQTYLPANATIDVDHTQPALDLTTLFNGFQPLFRLLNPEDVNKLSYQIVQVFQGEGATVDQLVARTASLTQTVAAKDKVIGEVIDNLTTVLDTVNGRTTQLNSLLVTLRQLVSGLSDDRAVIGSTITGLGDLTVSVSQLLEEGRAPLKSSIDNLGDVSEILADNKGQLERFLRTTPTKFDRIGRTGSYGSWVNFYACSIQGAIPNPQGYLGGVGVERVAERCFSR